MNVSEKIPDYSNCDLFSKIRFRLIRLLAGKSGVVMNVEIKTLPADKCSATVTVGDNFNGLLLYKSVFVDPVDGSGYYLTSTAKP